MSKAAKTRIVSYICAGALALGLWGYARSADLEDARRAASYSASRSFEETVTAVSALSETLAKSVYATDRGFCARICGEACAQARAAESALSILPFSTQELEQISGFLNLAGDYAASLCGEAALAGFTPEEIDTLSQFSATARDLVGSLLELQQSVHGGDVVMDSPKLRLRNVEDADGSVPISARMLAYEADFTPPETPDYDGKYARAEEESRGYLTEEAMRKLAAEYAGVNAEDLVEEYAYEGPGGRRCFRAGDLFLCASRSGVESMAQSRLVGEARIDEYDAQLIAEDFLAARSFRDLELWKSERSGAVAEFHYVKTENGALCLDNGLLIAVALDDGSLYSFNAAGYSGEDSGARFVVDEAAAAQALPDTLRQLDVRRVVRRSPGGRDLACYAFSCADREGGSVTVYVDAADGRMWDIEL